MTNETQAMVQDEITLKELIQILLDYKWLIVGITALTFILAAIYSYLIADPVYESKAVLNASPIGVEMVNDGDIESIVNGSGVFPISTVETYMEQLRSPQLLIKVISELNLLNDEGNQLKTSTLQNMIDIRNVDNTNLLEIVVTSSEPEKAEIIANSLAKNFIVFIDDAGKSQSNDTAKKIEAQLLVEETNLADKSEKLAAFMADSVSIDELKSEIGSLVSQMTNSKSILNSLQVTIEANRSQLQILEAQVSNDNYILDSIELNSNGQLTGESIKVNGSDNNQLGSSLVTIEYVNTQNSLIASEARYNAYTEQLSELETKLIEKQSLLVEEEYKYDRLNREVSLAKQTYTAYQERYQEAIVAAVAEIGSNNIVISSEAVVPERPTGPNKTLNMAIGLVLGGMIGVFVAFFRAYWKSA